MKKLLFLLIAFYSLAGFAQDKVPATKDYWVYIKAIDEITTTKMIAGRSQKGDIVDAIPCANSKDTPRTPGYFICKMALTETKRAEMLEPYTEVKTIPAEIIDTTRTVKKDVWLMMQKEDNYFPFIEKPTDMTNEYELEGDSVFLSGKISIPEHEEEEIKAYRKNKIALETFKASEGIDSKTAVTTDKLSVPPLIEKDESDLSTLLQKAEHYERYQLPFIRVAQWFNNLFPQARAAGLVRYVNTASSGGDGTTNATSGATAAYASLNLCEDAEDGDLTDNGGDTLTINCSGTSADTEVTFDGWVTGSAYYISIIGNLASGKWDTTKYRIESSGTNCIYVKTGYVRISRMQTHCSATNGYRCGILFYYNNASSDFRVDRSIVRRTLGGGDYGALCNAYSNAVLSVKNCIVYMDSNSGNALLRANTAQNCTLYGANSGNGASYSECTNVLAYNFGTDFSGCTGNYNFSEDDTAPGANSIHGVTDEKSPAFVSTTDDFRLQSTSDAINAGTDLYSSGVTTDIDGDTLTVRNDIGADEYVSSGGSATPCVRPIMIMKVPRRYIKWMNG